jgi:polar amino acid transport system substrate-binding protein
LEITLPIFIIAFLYLLSVPLNAEQLHSANAHWPPWRVVEEDGRLSGIEIDILEGLSTRLDLQLVTKGCGWKRCLKHMEVGESDVMTGLFKNSEREKYMTFISPPYRVEANICFYQDIMHTEEINSYDDLSKLTVGVVNKVSYFKQFDDDKNINKHQETTDADLFRLLQAKRIDTVIMACVTGDIFLHNSGLKGSFKHANYVNHVESPVYLAISNKSPFLARKDDLSNALQGMINDGEIKQIMATYGVQEIK